MVAERPFIVIGPGFQGGEVQSVSRHLIKTAAHQVGVTSHQVKVSFDFLLITQWRTVAAVKLFNLFEGEIFE